MKKTMRIVRIGGGSSAHVLRGLMQLGPHVHVTAIVPMADSGGSSGELRNQWGVLPPGDVLKALIALSALPLPAWEALNRFLRFRANGNGLSGHAVGNFLLAGFERFTSRPREGIRVLEQALEVRGKVAPVTCEDAHLHAELTDGTIVEGETHIDLPKEGRPLLPIDKLWLKPHARADEEALEAIARADCIVLGPTDLYSSLGACLVVNGLAEAVRSSQAPVIFVMPLMTKRGETGGFDEGTDFPASRILAVVEAWLERSVDIVLCNNRPLRKEALELYEREAAHPVEQDLAPGVDAQGRYVRLDNLLEEDAPLDSAARHHAWRTACMIALFAGDAITKREATALS